MEVACGAPDTRAARALANSKHIFEVQLLQVHGHCRRALRARSGSDFGRAGVLRVRADALRCARMRADERKRAQTCDRLRHRALRPRNL